MTPKIATCCYCGTRAALRLDNVRHELTCSSCGAPLRNLKQIAVERQGRPAGEKKRKKSRVPPEYSEHYRPSYKRKKRRKSLMSKVFEEAFDVIEDIFD